MTAIHSASATILSRIVLPFPCQILLLKEFRRGTQQSNQEACVELAIF